MAKWIPPGAVPVEAEDKKWQPPGAVPVDTGEGTTLVAKEQPLPPIPPAPTWMDKAKAMFLGGRAGATLNWDDEAGAYVQKKLQEAYNAAPNWLIDNRYQEDPNVTGKEALRDLRAEKKEAQGGQSGGWYTAGDVGAGLATQTLAGIATGGASFHPMAQGMIGAASNLGAHEADPAVGDWENFKDATADAGVGYLTNYGLTKGFGAVGKYFGSSGRVAKGIANAEEAIADNKGALSLLSKVLEDPASSPKQKAAAQAFLKSKKAFTAANDLSGTAVDKAKTFAKGVAGQVLPVWAGYQAGKAASELGVPYGQGLGTAAGVGAAALMGDRGAARKFLSNPVVRKAAFETTQRILRYAPEVLGQAGAFLNRQLKEKGADAFLAHWAHLIDNDPEMQEKVKAAMERENAAK